MSATDPPTPNGSHHAPGDGGAPPPFSRFAIGRLRAELTWLAGILVVATSSFYALGFAAIQSHLNLLGISRLVDVQNRDYLVTGVEMILFLPLYLFIGLLPWLLIWVTVRLLTPAVTKALRWSLSTIPQSIPAYLILAGFLFFIWVWVLRLTPQMGILLSSRSEPTSALHGLLLQGGKGRGSLQLVFSVYVGAVAVYLLYVSLHWRKGTVKWPRVFFSLSFIGILSGLALIPVAFGLYVIPIKYPHAIIELKHTAQEEAKHAGQGNIIHGWVLNRSIGGQDKAVVLYPARNEENPTKRIIVISGESYERITIDRFTFVFDGD